MFKKSYIGLLLCLVIASTVIFSGCFIRGRIVDQNGRGIAGVTVRLNGPQSGETTTDRRGNYQFGSLERGNRLSEGNYTITPTGNFSPTSEDATITTRVINGFGTFTVPVSRVEFREASSTEPDPGVCTYAEIDVPLLNTGADVDAKGNARHRVREDCEQDFRVEIEDVPTGDYDLFVGGVNLGTITVVDTGLEIEGDIDFDTDPDDPDEILLDFDPRGQLIEIEQGGTVFLSLSFTEPDPGVCTYAEIDVPLLNTGADVDAKGNARHRVREDCEQDFRVEIEDVPTGDYDLFVGGVNLGTITVVDTGLEIEGDIDFDTDPDDPDEILLDFDPRGQLIEIEQGGTVFLSLSFPAA